MLFKAFADLVEEWLQLKDFAGVDEALNGMQVGSLKSEVRRVAFAVDASLESVRRAAEWGADLLFVHHGLFWGKHLAVTGVHYRRLRELFDRDLALFAVHLPLDAHPEVGNNYGLARFLGMKNLLPFGTYKGVKIGVKGEFEKERSLEEISSTLCAGGEPGLGVLSFGRDPIRTAGIVSGGGTDEAWQAIEEGLDLFITGDASHILYHHSLEARINMLFAGHYRTEVFGVKQMAERLPGKAGLEACFLDIPTGL